MENSLRKCALKLKPSVGKKIVADEWIIRTLDVFDFQEETNEHAEDETNNAKVKRRKLETGLSKMQMKSMTRGDEVKEAGEVLKECENKKQPRCGCRVQAFGKICRSFDGRRKRWVMEMGFGGLLDLIDRCPSNDLCYWLMTRVDPANELLRATDEREFKLSKDQVRWVLGIPEGDEAVPRKVRDNEMRSKVKDIKNLFWREYDRKLKTDEEDVNFKGIRLTKTLIKRVKGSWDLEQEEEFKTAFLILALLMVLCPTQASPMGSDLVPALTCAIQAKNYDWCGLVLEKLFDSCNRFGQKFYADGYAKGFGGCSIFLAIFYLDRLDRDPVMWSRWPRIKVWTTKEMEKARDEDRLAQQGDFGNLGCIDVAYGKKHPREDRDTDGISSVVEKGLSRDLKSLQSKEKEAILECSNVIHKRKNRKRRRITAMYPDLRWLKRAKRKRVQAGVPNVSAQANKIPVASEITGFECPSLSRKNLEKNSVCEEVSPQKCPNLSVNESGGQNSCCEKPTEEEVHNEDGGNGDEGYISLAEEISTPVATNFAVVTEPVCETGDKMPSPHECADHTDMVAPSCCLLSRCLLEFEKMHIDKYAKIKIHTNLDQTTEEDCKIITDQNNSNADHSVCFLPQSKVLSTMPKILVGSVEENNEGVLPCLRSSSNVAMDSSFVEGAEKLYIEEMHSSMNNDSLNKNLADSKEIMPSSSLGVAIEKANRVMDSQIKEVIECKDRRGIMSSNRSAPSCDKNSGLEISREDEGILSQSTHQRGLNEVSDSMINDKLFEIDQHEKIHEDNFINTGTRSKHSEGSQPRDETETETETDPNNEQQKAAKVDVKLVDDGSCDHPVIIADENENEEENDDFDPFKEITSDIEKQLDKLERIVFQKLASKFAFSTRGKKL